MVDNNNGNDSKINVVHDDIINENIDTIDIIDDHTAAAPLETETLSEMSFDVLFSELISEIMRPNKKE
ncbi:hypothetical protein DERF_012389 [Dermatophagoides farinae]|uniref:Uncharacterized protein n=1 Tax=Dermatophagoides farinae TaxID=6954 RepID=A0A922HU00_DERFA|nr:hypothetical protein DERF_012389 [Dermatophagoides farinae]